MILEIIAMTRDGRLDSDEVRFGVRVANIHIVIGGGQHRQ